MRFLGLVAVLGPGLVFAPLAIGEAADAPGSPQQERQATYRDVATLECGGGEVSAVGGSLRPSGFTLVPVDTRDAGKCRFAISTATSLQGPDPGDLRVLAKDQDGKLHRASSQSAASASGNKHRVVTVVCDFRLPEKNVRALVVQRRLLVGTVDLGIVKARVLLDDEEDEERLGVIQP